MLWRIYIYTKKGQIHCKKIDYHKQKTFFLMFFIQGFLFLAYNFVYKESNQFYALTELASKREKILSY